MTGTEKAAIKDQLAEYTQAGQVWEALHHLNSLTPHRYSAMFIFDDATCVNMYGVDKENPEAKMLFDVPASHSYCVFTRQLARTLVIKDAMQESFLTGHVMQEAFRSYLAVPLTDNSGTVVGTACHFDARVLPITDEAVELLEALGPMLLSVAEARRQKIDAWQSVERPIS